MMPDSDITHRVKPFLKWAGGKRWFVSKHADLIPSQFKRYIEPFLGSGAVFFHIQPAKAILGDSNPELIITYQAVKEDWRLVRRYLLDHQRLHCESYYYEIRKSRPRDMAIRAARFIYLNRTCWNGLYRVNRQGVFNVPIGTRTSVTNKDEDFESASALLARATLMHSDFEVLVNEAGSGDLLFVDPPYTVSHNNNAFMKYNEKLFSWVDQERLFRALNRARLRGARVLATNACHDSIRELYAGLFDVRETSRTSTLSSLPESRGPTRELIILGGMPYAKRDE